MRDAKTMSTADIQRPHVNNLILHDIVSQCESETCKNTILYTDKNFGPDPFCTSKSHNVFFSLILPLFSLLFQQCLISKNLSKSSCNDLCRCRSVDHGLWKDWHFVCIA